MYQADSPVSILRIKRKRGAAPLDGFVLEDLPPTSSPKRLRSNVDRAIFRFAETVPVDSFASAAETKALKERINALTHLPAVRPATPTTLVVEDTPSIDLKCQTRARYRVVPKDEAVKHESLQDKKRSASIQIVDVEQDVNSFREQNTGTLPSRAKDRSMRLTEDENSMDNFGALLKEYLSRKLSLQEGLHFKGQESLMGEDYSRRI